MSSGGTQYLCEVVYVSECAYVYVCVHARVCVCVCVCVVKQRRADKSLFIKITNKEPPIAKNLPTTVAPELVHCKDQVVLTVSTWGTTAIVRNVALQSRSQTSFLVKSQTVVLHVEPVVLETVSTTWFLTLELYSCAQVLGYLVSDLTWQRLTSSGSEGYSTKFSSTRQ